MQLLRVGFIGASAALAATISCTRVDPTEEPAAPACSNGPVHERGFDRYEYVGRESASTVCTPHCGYTGAPTGPGQSLYYADALPSGACDGAASPCSMSIAVTCCGDTSRGPSGGPIHEMRCDCVGGTWKCGMRLPGTGVCGCRSDAGADAAIP